MVRRQTWAHPVRRPHCSPGSWLPAADHPAPSAKPSAGIAGSLEVNRNSRVNVHFATQLPEVNPAWSSSRKACRDSQQRWFGEAGRKHLLAHAPSPVSTHLNETNPVLFGPSLAVRNAVFSTVTEENHEAAQSWPATRTQLHKAKWPLHGPFSFFRKELGIQEGSKADTMLSHGLNRK